MQEIRRTYFRRLQLRRPLKYSGIESPSWNHMRKYLATLNQYRAVTILRCWSGVAMVGQHKETLQQGEKFPCACGCESQTLEHLMWDCDLVPGKPEDLLWWSLLSPAEKLVLLPASGREPGYYSDWRRVCNWAIDVLGISRDLQPRDEIRASRPPLFPYSANGHLVVLAQAGEYTYCGKCHISRRLRDHHFIKLHPCPLGSELPTLEGDYACRQGHLVRMGMAQWKMRASRPQWECVLCHKKQWSTGSFGALCRFRFGNQAS